METLAVSGIVLSALVYIIWQYSKGAKNKSKSNYAGSCAGCKKECDCE